MLDKMLVAADRTLSEQQKSAISNSLTSCWSPVYVNIIFHKAKSWRGNEKVNLSTQVRPLYKIHVYAKQAVSWACLLFYYLLQYFLNFPTNQKFIYLKTSFVQLVIDMLLVSLSAAAGRKFSDFIISLQFFYLLKF